MELHEAIRRRTMCRSFSDQPVDPVVLEHILDAALRSPTAGNTRGTSWVVLHGSDETAVYWDATTDEGWRTRNPDWAAGLRQAPVLLLAYASPAAYVARYAEAGKAQAGLGAGADRWTVPYWYGDAAFGVMAVLLAAVDAGLGACLLGAFRGERPLAGPWVSPTLGGSLAPWRWASPDGLGHRSSSLLRSVPSRAERIHRGHWSG